MSVAFHYTRVEHVPSILIQGLQPGGKKGMSGNERSPVIHLTTDPSFVRNTMLGEARNWALLQVDTKGINLYPEMFISAIDGKLARCPGCWITLEERIPAERIRVA